MTDRSDPNDERLALRCQLGHADAIDELIARWHMPLWRYVRRVTGKDDAADDAVQDAWVRILRALPSLRTPARLRSWLFAIAHRVLMDRLRAQYSAPAAAPLDDAALGVLAGEPARDSLLHTQLDAVEHALAALPVIERDVIALFYLEELSLADIAEVMAVPVGTVKSRLFRARTLLKERLTDAAIR